MTINRKSVKLIRSDYADIMIKVATDVYHLDRLQLALKSDYFEKLFIDDFHEKKCDLIELPAMDSDIFSAVVDVIYGKYLGSVITVENCVSLLMAMDYLQMRIDLRVYARFIEKNTGIELLSDSIIFQLYDFISQNQNFKILLPPVFKYLSSHLMDVRGYEEFLSLPLEHFIEIILAGHLPEDMKCIREFSEICVEWISYDWENRLPHIIKLVNAAKCILQSPYCIKDDNLRINLDNLSQEMKQEKVSRYFQRLLYYKGEINIAPEKSKITSNKGFYDGSHDKIMRNKLARFLENGNFYDITVEVEGKTYKLNRFKLKSMCGYFAKLFSAESTAEISAEPEKSLKTSIHSNKDEAYSLDEIDHTAFELIIDYMYLNELGLTSNTIIKVLKADSILQIKGLQCKCESWMMNHIGKINTDLAAEIMNFTRGNVRFEDFHKLYFREVVPATWPEMADNVSLFSSVSFDMLEEILLSETLPSFANPKSTPDFCIDDQHKLLDICSKWIIHDLKNRFHLIPRIALAINCNYMVDYDDYKVETPADFINWSQRDVRDELWKILCSTLSVPSNMSLENYRRRFKKEPAFISGTDDNKIHILNDEFDHVASLNFSERCACCESFSSTMIDDNVFILTQFDHNPDKPDRRIFFQVYNLSSKKCISLCDIPTCMRKMSYPDHLKCTLLNCCNEVHCCYEFGSVLKYSLQMNRWTRLSKCTFQHYVRFASEGEKLYRMYKTPASVTTVGLRPESIYVVDIYDSKQKMWISAPNLSLRTNEYSCLIDLTFVNGNELAALFESTFYLFNESSQMWHQFTLPNERPTSVRSVVAQSENEILHLFDNKLYNFSRNQDHWTLKKELPLKYYNDVTAIHRPDILP